MSLTKIEHAENVFTINGVLSEVECKQLIELAETSGFEAADVRTGGGSRPMLNVRNNDRVMFPAPEWIETVWNRLQGAFPALEGMTAGGLPKDLRFYRYGPGQRFKMHKDGAWTENGLRSKLTLLIYLNDDYVGGATDFRDYVVTPKTGSALVFVHNTWHEGTTVETGTKYVLRSDVLYS